MAIVLRRLKTALWITKIINRTTFGVHCLYISWKTNFNCKSFLFDLWNYLFPCPVTNCIRVSNKTGNKLGGRSLIHGRGTKCLSSFTCIKLTKKSMLSQTPKFDCHLHNFTPLYRLWETLSGSRIHITFPQDRGVQITRTRSPWRLYFVRWRQILLGYEYGTWFVSLFRRLIEATSGFLENLCAPALGPILILLKYNVLMSVTWDRQVIKFLILWAVLMKTSILIPPRLSRRRQ